MGGEKEKKDVKRPAVACSDGRARALPTVLWLANLEVPDPEWRKGEERAGSHTVR